tara:strand:+ start:58 stop:675 length:618 start_codon:yes stop_codon:yes gene_type:complete
MNNTVILANGSFPKHNLAIKILNEAETIICCDGSINNLDRLNIVPTQIIGDMDSISNELKVKYRSKLIEILDQDQNDLRKSINWLEQNNYKSAIILGATGSREDHSLGNIFTLLEYPAKIDLKIISNYGQFTVINKKTKLRSFSGQQISLFSIDKEIKISSNNLKYNLKNSNLKTLYSGTLNESKSDFITINISHGSILIYQLFK